MCCVLFLLKVAEFANVKKQLEVLEDRLDSMVQPKLTDAISKHKVCLSLEEILLTLLVGLPLFSYVVC